MVFQKFHSLSHGGAKATSKLIGERHVFSSMPAYINEKCRSCIACQKSKITRHNKAPIKSYQEPPGRLQVWQIDLSGSLPNNNSCRYLFTCTDCYTRWMEAVGVPDATAATCARALMPNIIARLGVPSQIVCDNGQAFTAQLFQEFCSNFGIKVTHSTPYHSFCNSMLEGCFRTLKAALRAQDNPTNSTKNLPLVLLVLRSFVKEDTNVSSAHMVYGTSLHLPGQFFDQTTMEQQPTSEYMEQLILCMSNMRSIAPQHYCSPPVHLDKNLRTCSHVLVRVDTPKGALNPRYPETHKVLQRQDKYFTLAMNGRLPNVSTDHLKVAYVLSSAMEHEQRPSTSADMIDVIYKDIVLADKNQSNSVTGRNSVNRKLNRPDIIYHYNDLLRKPKQTRYVRLIQTSNRYLD